MFIYVIFTRKLRFRLKKNLIMSLIRNQSYNDTNKNRAKSFASKFSLESGYSDDIPDILFDPIPKPSLQKLKKNSDFSSSTHDFYPKHSLGSSINLKNRKANLRRSYPCQRVKPTEKFSDMILNGNEILNTIIKTLKETRTYELSDWEEEEAMKQGDMDTEAETVNGKDIPQWASHDHLIRSINRQSLHDGDCIFQNLDRRCDLSKVFGTNTFKYYTQRMKKGC